MAKPVATRGFARERVLESALELFADHGVSGTSLQMIADRLGVTKAAVYYQFHSKDDIALAVVKPVFDDIEHLLRITETLPTPAARRGVSMSGLVELIIRHRRVSSVFYGDPTVHHLLEGNDEFRRLGDRLADVLLGPDPDTATRVAISMLSAGVHGCVTDPMIGDVGDDELQQILLDLTKAFLDVCVHD
ncbi:MULTISPECIES: TetR/AcrR family transcriptional regulator [Mycolicibacterium]|uniref:TetR/AcrR family transcriptional regulator n=1 Tax=Mycolicibacterium austroafricanum TaxID=39687 RepID=A0ABT8HHY5_MYCAO|nr:MULTISPECIES: TetR/AcrR family transcriptional regulator [Mycolicibacterium]MDN4520160.1 TetR/AcrR family transcriptional regulator [Mycolicibacterium austroafricanum]MDW5611022.1 TetR/AcrR family transcriptional regulator [Mycolicibacterium sp. D5.8-2]QZY47685.1 TetR/AcrR family transcriptional regulator [Mycolicibacterium austroafricanum]